MRYIRQSALILLLTLLLAELATRLVLPQPGLQPFPPNQPRQLLVRDSTRSYAYRPGFSGTVHEAPFAVDVTINNLGMRDSSVVAGESVDVLAVGDSFTAGYMVNVADAWPERFEHYLQAVSREPRSIRVLNAGVSGYSLEQIRLTAEKFAYLQPKFVVVGVLPAVADRLINPYRWFAGYAMRAEKIPFLEKQPDGVLSAFPDTWLSPKTQFWLMHHFRFAAYIWLAVAPHLSPAAPVKSDSTAGEGELMARLLHELDRLHTFTQSRGTQLVVLLIDFQQPDGSFSSVVKQQNKQVIEFCETHHIPVFDPLPLLEATSQEPVFRVSDEDYHWTPLAHDIAARGLANYLAELQNRS